jgi:hypothetical protein
VAFNVDRSVWSVSEMTNPPIAFSDSAQPLLPATAASGANLGDVAPAASGAGHNRALEIHDTPWPVSACDTPQVGFRPELSQPASTSVARRLNTNHARDVLTFSRRESRFRLPH